MIEILGLLIIILFIAVCLYGREPHIFIPKGGTSFQWAGENNFYIGMPKGVNHDFIGSGSQWLEVKKSVVAETKSSCYFVLDGEPAIIVARTDGIHIIDKLLKSIQIFKSEIQPTSISVSNYFGNGTITIYVSVINGNNLFLVRENGEWLEFAEKYQCHLPEDSSCAMFVDLRNRGAPDIICTTNNGIFIFPNSANEIVPFIKLLTIPYDNLRVADFNNSGRQSLLLSSDNDTSVIYNTGDYEFSAPEKLGRYGKCDVCDLNNNGRMDFVGSSIMMNRGGGNFVWNTAMPISSYDVKIISVGGIESIYYHYNRVRRNAMTNKKCRKIERKCDMDTANSTMICEYENGETLAIQNIISSECQLPYYKFGFARSSIKSLHQIMR